MEAVKSTLFYFIVIPLLKVSVTNQDFLFQQLLYNKVDFTAPNFEAAVGLQIEAAEKMKVATRVLDHRTIQNCFTRKNFFELTTPNVYL